MVKGYQFVLLIGACPPIGPPRLQLRGGTSKRRASSVTHTGPRASPRDADGGEAESGATPAKDTAGQEEESGG